MNIGEVLDKKAQSLGWDNIEEMYNKVNYTPFMSVIEQCFEEQLYPTLSKDFIKKKMLEGFKEANMELIRPDRVSFQQGLKHLFKYLEHKGIKLNL